jgi:hypothetical protein
MSTDIPDLIRDAIEIYRASTDTGDRLAVVHWRQEGIVRYHEQSADQTSIPFSQFYQMPAERFDDEIAKHDAKRVTVDELDLPIMNDT